MPQCGEYDRDRSYNAGTVFDHGMDFGSLVSEDSKNIGDPKRDETMEESCEIEVETFHNYVKSDDQSAHLDSEKPERRPRGLVYLCLFFGTLAVLVGIILALYYTLRKDEVAKRSPSTDEKSAITGEVDLVKPLSDAAQYLLDILEDHTSPSILLDPNTYQGQAFEDLVAREEVSADSTPAFQVVQQYALLSLYRSSSGDSWDVNFGWNSPQTDTCKWYGVSTCRLLENGELAVTNLDLSSTGLSGVIPEEICLLGELEALDLSRNTLSGPIPTCVVEYRNLEVFNVQHNELTGDLPRGLLTIPTLDVVDLGNNQLTGSLGSWFNSASSDMNIFNLDGNMLSGEITLTKFNVDGNMLTGVIPEGICLLGKHLKVLDLSSNTLSGPIPTCVAEYRILEYFNVRGNELTGDLPHDLLTIPTLDVADLGKNQLTGSLDSLFVSESSNASKNSLNIFNVDGNMLSGDIPSEFSAYTAILKFRDNDFVGTVDDSFCDDSAVEVDCEKVTCSCCVNCN